MVEHNSSNSGKEAYRNKRRAFVEAQVRTWKAPEGDDLLAETVNPEVLEQIVTYADETLQYTLQPRYKKDQSARSRARKQAIENGVPGEVIKQFKGGRQRQLITGWKTFEEEEFKTAHEGDMSVKGSTNPHVYLRDNSHSHDLGYIQGIDDE